MLFSTSNLKSVFCKFRRQKRISADFWHSEWNRRLGVCSVAAMAATMILTLSFYVVLPRLFTNYSQRGTPLPIAPPISAFLLAYLLMALAGSHHLAWMAEKVPKSSLLYHFAYCTSSEVAAFGIAWNHLMDWLAIIALILHTISDHVNLLFHNVIENNFRMAWGKYELILEELPPSSVAASNQYSLDWFSLVVLLVGGAILCCSTRVLVTITVIFLISALFTATSTTVVALLHNMAHLRVNYAHFVENYDQLMEDSCYFLIGFLAIEALAFLADETDQPAKVIPSAFKCSVKISCLVTFMALLAFFPFVYRISFDENTALPAVFNSLSIFSARYLMNVGSICGLTATLLCVFVSPTRLLYSLSKDKLLPGQAGANLAALYGKGGSPRLAVAFVTFFVGLLLILVPKGWLIHCIPLNVCLRLLFTAIMVFKSNFAAENCFELVAQSEPAKYRRFRNRDRTISGSSASPESGSGYSSTSSNAEEAVDMHIVEQLWQMSQNADEQRIGENSMLLVGTPSKSNGTAVSSGHYNSISSQEVFSKIFNKPHNCLISPCASNLHIAGESINRPRLHIYDASSVNANLALETGTNHSYQYSGSSGGEPFADDAESLEKTSNRFLATFIIMALLIAVSHRILRQTEEFVPILAVISLCIGLVFSFAISFQLLRLTKIVDKYEFIENNAGGQKLEVPMRNARRSRWRVLGCLVSIFLLIQILAQFSLLKYAAMFAFMTLGLVIYTSAIQAKS